MQKLIIVESLLFYIVTVQSHAYYEPFKMVNLILKIEFMFETHDMRLAICDLRLAICDLRFAICDLRFAIYDLRFAISD